MNETNVTVVGNLVADPVQRVTARTTASQASGSPAPVAVRRRGCSVDGRTWFYPVSCWRQLARNAAESLRKGERVVVIGRLEVRGGPGTTRCSAPASTITADHVGHDLTFGTSRFTKAARRRRGGGGGRRRADAPRADDEEAPCGPAESDAFVRGRRVRIDRDGVPETAPAPV